MLSLFFDGFPHGAFQVLHWGSRVLRRVARSSGGAEALAVQEHIDIVEPLKKVYDTFVRGKIAVNLIMDCENLYESIGGKSVTNEKIPRNVARAVQNIKNLVTEKTINNIALISGKDNPADPLTKSLRAETGALMSLMSIQALPQMKNFKWMRQRGMSST